jgi:hypothetical protein
MTTTDGSEIRTKLAVGVLGLHALISLHVAVGDSTSVILAVNLVGQDDGFAAILVLGAAPVPRAKLPKLIVLGDFSRILTAENRAR